MSLCEGGLIKITTVPEYVLTILDSQVRNWDFVNYPYHYDKVFGKHKLKSYHTGRITKDIEYTSDILPVINWVENVAGSNQKVVRCFLNLMEPNQTFRIHVDTLKVHLIARRLHIPIIVGKNCKYYTYTDSKQLVELEHSMEYGYLYELDNIRPHNVKNGEEYRVNFICDVMNINDICEGLNSIDPDQNSKLDRLIRDNPTSYQIHP